MKHLEQTNHPITFRIPQSGTRDPHFSLTRSFYYAAEAAGQLKLVRLKKRGNRRGITLVPYAAVVEMLRENDAGPT
ncbi:hypothetical protein KBY66_15355 [Synechococcus sp. Tobar12-5m-g]|uniref:hypothetical protein n=1 Tax=Synechococcus sp. Tobar12-5m-g TaxID=2823742 RepID=UPI0020CE6371|nr:hypothetical protein [Synechococcus sp. Tobar12-5m-g]MCP9773965.1 hypothetical protein [Synechococcus sp. Tobar12-5m-g]